MPKPKRTKASPVYSVNYHTLSEGARDAMLRALNVEKRESEAGDGFEFWERVEMWLGSYVPGLTHQNKIPIPSQYVSEFTALAKKSLRLLDDLRNLGGYFRDALDRRASEATAGPPFQLRDLETGLAQLHRFATAIAAKHSTGKPVRGAKGNLALYQTIQSLRSFFHERYRGPDTPRPQRGAFVSLSERETRELAFVREALLDARIMTSKQADKALPRLMKHTRCALPHERAQTIERIAGNVMKKRREQGRAL